MNKFDLTNFRNINLPSESELISRWWGSPAIPKVSFVCLAYNHEKFIEDTIRGFLLQETDFPFEIIIHDDASLDNTAAIINRYRKLYPKIITPILQTENKYSKDRHSILHSLCDVAKGKYIAICEGDDFWFCHNKISNQVNIHEINLDVSLSYSKAYIYIESRNEFSNTVGRRMQDKDIYSRNGIPTLTVMFEKRLLSGFYDYVALNQHKWLQSDYQLWLWLNMKGNIYFEDNVTSVYRALDSSASRPSNVQAQYNFRKSVLSTSTYFAKRNCNISTFRQIMLKNHFFLYMWCLKRKLPQAQFHKKKILALFSKRKTFGIKIMLSFLIEKILVPTYFKLSRRK